MIFCCPPKDNWHFLIFAENASDRKDQLLIKAHILVERRNQNKITILHFPTLGSHKVTQRHKGIMTGF
jgi:hypothetical protein